MQLPARLGKYELLEFLGGGMSHVYRAVDSVIGRTVAIKILTDTGCADEDTRARFLQEARTAARISHENILTIYEYGELEGQPFLVMEFLRGEDLRKAILNGHTGDTPNRLRIALQVARAIEHIHSNQITHRDIKPENVHINSAGVAKLMDFGIAKSEGTTMTRAGFIIGTPCYMAPEQVLGKTVTNLVDVYAFGVLLFELFTGNKLVTGDSVQRIFYSILNEPHDLTPLSSAGAPEGVRSLIARCIAKNPAERIRSFGEICVELDRLSHAETPKAPVRNTVSLTARIEAVSAALEPLLVWLRGAWVWLKALWLKRWAPPVAIAAVIVILSGAVWLTRQSNTRRQEKSAPARTLPATLATQTGEMLLVPAGAFRFGATRESVSLPAFYIDRTEVTNEEYEKFCRSSRHPLPKNFATGRPYLPVVNVSISDARAFAAWARKRIPTAQEWEKAARGTDGRSYPWGNEAESKRANVLSSEGVASAGLAPANAFTSGSSPYGVLQMCGNAWELVEEPVRPDKNVVAAFEKLLRRRLDGGQAWASIRGGAFNRTLVVTFDRATIPASFTSGEIGFRCVEDPPVR